MSMQIMKEFYVDNNGLQVLATGTNYQESINWLKSIGFKIVGEWSKDHRHFIGCMGTILWSRKFIYNEKNHTLYDWDYDRFDLDKVISSKTQEKF